MRLGSWERPIEERAGMSRSRSGMHHRWYLGRARVLPVQAQETGTWDGYEPGVGYLCVRELMIHIVIRDVHWATIWFIQEDWISTNSCKWVCPGLCLR